MRREALLSPLGIPCNPPPWGTLAAVELATGKVRWEVPLGTTRDQFFFPIPFRLGMPNMGGPIATAGGLVFIGAAMDNYLRAFDTDTGTELWKGRLPAGGQATPMTYRLRESDRQFVVIAAGGHNRMGTKLGDHDPELRHTVLSLCAFRDLKEIIAAHSGDREQGIAAFCGQNDGDGWMLPEALRLSDLGLGHDERAKELQPVRERLGEP